MASFCNAETKEPITTMYIASSSDDNVVLQASNAPPTGMMSLPQRPYVVVANASIVVLAPHFHAWIVPGPKEGSKDKLVIKLPQPAALKVIVDIPRAIHANEQRLVEVPGKGPRFDPAGKDLMFRLQLKPWEMDGWKDAGEFIQTRFVANPGKVVFEHLTPGKYDFTRTNWFQLGDRGQGGLCDRRDVTFLPGETKTIRLERKRGQCVEGMLHGLPKDVPGGFLMVRSAEATGDPAKTEEWKLPVYDSFICPKEEKFQTALLEPGRYTITASAYRSEPMTGVITSGVVLPEFVGTAEVTIEDDDPAAPKKPAPSITIVMKSRVESKREPAKKY